MNGEDRRAGRTGNGKGAGETSTRSLPPEPQALRERPELRCPQARPAAARASSSRRQRGRSSRPGSERASSTDACAFVLAPFPRFLSVLADFTSVAYSAQYYARKSRCNTDPPPLIGPTVS